MPALRHIAVHVEEPRGGRFVWVLTERRGDDWQPLDRAGTAVRSYQRAMAEGLLALQQLVDDLDLGPRADEDADADAEDPAAPPAREHTQEAPHKAAPNKGAYFGFGPAR
ncbi:hypothetical protein [Pseudorhodoferax sp. Leaf265]|uniref:hypothetical protein n=1 Tax=Pseudorhodoferax sp. Leaf265 TaxID=1736315 RepID=UPI0006FB1043|nr:hypothetical protein [Pseudorhodoferax sp. Leaf265]KQP02136.1 hypothetical protein ASF45_18830 [Pseudorhodoferax sp. Leaf265]